MHFSRQQPTLPDPYGGISLYADLSQATIMVRNNLVSITKIVHNHRIVYKWGFRVKLIVDRKQIFLKDVSGEGTGASVQLGPFTEQ